MNKLRSSKKNQTDVSFDEVHRLLTTRHKVIRRKLILGTLIFGLMFASLHSISSTEAFNANSELSVDETYAVLANGNENDKLLSVTEGGFFMRGNLENATENRVGVNGVLNYTVQPGDSVSMIAQNFGIDTDTVLAVNNLSNANSLRVGQNLLILPVNGLLHKVVAKETIASIATKYKVEAEKILEQNNLVVDEALTAGRELIIPGAKREVAATRYIASSYSTDRSVGAIPDLSLSTGKLLWPTSGKITQYYHSGHYAIDIGNRSQPMIVAARRGTVITAATGWNGGYGNYVILDHGDGMQTLYAHQDYLSVAVGDTVEAGDVLGRMGNSGRVYGATGIHLHFEVRVNGVKKNPLAYL